MTDSTRKTIIRHLKGIVSALEKEESPDSMERLAADVNKALDGKWNSLDKHIMTLRNPLESRNSLSHEVKWCISSIAKERDINLTIEEGYGVSKVTFSKK